ncbi:FeoA domain-containing protein [Trueperella pyogenes]|uniref:FeoA domain-containing protein n=1 Tax=Trueperella pyogenes TaxID=1661 RepID=UPI003DA8B9A9
MLVFLGDLGVRPEKSAKVISQSAALGLTTILIDDETVSIPLPAACRIRVTLYPC